MKMAVLPHFLQIVNVCYQLLVDKRYEILVLFS